jgi:hypothetical protein
MMEYENSEDPRNATPVPLTPHPHPSSINTNSVKELHYDNTPSDYLAPHGRSAHIGLRTTQTAPKAFIAE